ncbi:hypothetical protein LTS18_000049 [Coniosporium uncinatum]|uniref:Uncharacterized protein n=1 Tax=Coniosporium uncinatum TaxID=93489 RepID=A0ACC3DDR2_9PEZI|nr:hypothetical protein LTS18_000049 [Coniosporium uncinatum]
MDTTTTRLRKAFKYPDDEDQDDAPDEMDEQEQEALITDLAAQDMSRTAAYTKAFLVLPLVALLPYLPSLVYPTSTALGTNAFLSIVSLAQSAYILYKLPLSTPSRTDDLWALVVPSDPREAAATGLPERWQKLFVLENIANVALVALTGWAYKDVGAEVWTWTVPGGQYRRCMGAAGTTKR